MVHSVSGFRRLRGLRECKGFITFQRFRGFRGCKCVMVFRRLLFMWLKGFECWEGCNGLEGFI